MHLFNKKNTFEAKNMHWFTVRKKKKKRKIWIGCKLEVATWSIVEKETDHSDLVLSEYLKTP